MPPPRLNPFAFPSDTDFRLGVLVVFIVASSLGGLMSMPKVFGLGGEPEDMLACVIEAHAGIEGLAGALLDQPPDALRTLWARFFSCVDEYVQVLAVVALAGPVLVLIVALALHALQPLWIIRRRELAPLDHEAPELTAELRELCREAGLRQPPRFVWNPLRPGGAFAFGRPGTCWVALFGDVVRRRVTDPEGFRAVVLHELAHVRNGDVNKTYFARNLWSAYLVVDVLPHFATLPWALEPDRTPGSLVGVGGRLLVVTLLVYLTRNAVLRARELYADVRASTDPATARHLRRLFEREATRRRAVLSGFGFHPPAARRLAVLDSTDELFRFGAWDSFITGLVAGMALPAAVMVSLILLVVASAPTIPSGWLTVIFGMVLPALATTALAIGALWTGMWRDSFAALVRGRPRQRTLRLGFGFTSGLVLGPGLSFDFALHRFEFVGELPSYLAPTGLGLALLLLWYAFVMLVLGAAIGLFLRWAQLSTDAWFEPSLAGRSPRAHLLIGFVLAALAFGLTFGLTLFVHVPLVILLPTVATYEQVPELLVWAAAGFLGVLILNPWNVIVLLALWVLPLAAHLTGRDGRPTALPGWVYLDDVIAGSVITARRPRLRPGLALMIGLAFAGVYLLAQLSSLRLMTSYLVGMGLTSTAVPVAIIIMTAAFQIPAALTTAACVQRLPIVHALFASFVTGILSGLAILTVPWLVGWSDAPDDPLFAAVQVIYAGALLALPFAWVAARVAAWQRRRFAIASGATASAG